MPRCWRHTPECCPGSRRCTRAPQWCARAAAHFPPHPSALTPPTYHKPPTLDAYVDFAAAVAAAAPSCAFWFYHFPAQTGLDVPLHRLLELSKGRIPTLAGAKFTSKDMG